MSGLVADVAELGRRVEGGRAAVKDLLLTALLAGRFDSLEEFNGRGRDLDLALVGRWMTAMVFSPVAQAGWDDGLVDDLERLVPEGLHGYGKRVLETDQVAFVLTAASLPDALLRQTGLLMVGGIRTGA